MTALLTVLMAIPIKKDWRTSYAIAFALLLMVLSSLVVVFYYSNYPRPELHADTPAYLDVVHQIQTLKIC